MAAAELLRKLRFCIVRLPIKAFLDTLREGSYNECGNEFLSGHAIARHGLRR